MGNIGYKPKDYTPGHPSVGKSNSKVMSNKTAGSPDGSILTHAPFKGQTSNPKGNNAKGGLTSSVKGMGVKIPAHAAKKINL